MSLAILAVMAWLVMMVFAVVPKRLTLTEIVFLYFVSTVMTITFFTTLDVDLQWVPLTRRVEGSFAMYLCRSIVIPFQILLFICVSYSHLKAKWRWGLYAAILLFFSLEDLVYLRLDLIAYRRWNLLYAILMYGSFMSVVWAIARWFVGLGKEDASKLGRNSL